MSRFLIEGFEAGGIQPPLWSINKWQTTIGDDPPAIVSVPSGGNESDGTKCLRVDWSASNHARMNVGNFYGGNEIYIKMRMFADGFIPTQTMMGFYFHDEREVTIGYFGFTPTYQWYYQSAERVQGGTAPPGSEWFILEFWLKLSTDEYTSDGEVELRVNGVSQFSNYAAKTNDTNNSGVNQAADHIHNIRFRGGRQYYYAYYDDIVCDSTSTWGVALNSSVLGYKLDSDSSTNWTPIPSSPNNYSNVTYTGGAAEGDADSIDAEYIATDASSTKDTYGVGKDFTPPVDGSAVVKCVQLQSRARREGPCLATKTRPFLKINGSEYAGVIEPPSYYNFITRYDLWLQNPDTSTDWLESDLDSLEVGVESST